MNRPKCEWCSEPLADVLRTRGTHLSCPTRREFDMDTLATIAARHGMQPYEAAAALDLTWPYDESAELPEPIAGEYDAILDAMRTDWLDTDPEQNQP